jgi:hypothetical protein
MQSWAVRSKFWRLRNSGSQVMLKRLARREALAQSAPEVINKLPFDVRSLAMMLKECKVRNRAEKDVVKLDLYFAPIKVDDFVDGRKGLPVLA